MLSVYEICAASSKAGGVATADLIVSGTVPITPIAGRTDPPAVIVQLYVWAVAADASHVQSMLSPAPAPVATIAPAESVTVTAHGRSSERRPWNLIGPPS